MARTVKRKLSDLISLLASFFIVWLGGPHSIARTEYHGQSARHDAFPRPHVSSAYLSSDVPQSHLPTNSPQAAGMREAADPHPAGGLTAVSTSQKYYVAQYGGGGNGPDGRGPLQFGPADLAGYGLSQSATAAVTGAVTDIARDCEDLPLEYRIDCLGKGLTLLASKVVPAANDYRDVKHELRRAGNRLRSIAQQNRDPAKPIISRTQTVSRQVSRARNYRPIKEESLRQAAEQAIRVIEEAQTRLLRSGESSQRRRVHYQAVSRSLGSTTRILRS